MKIASHVFDGYIGYYSIENGLEMKIGGGIDTLATGEVAAEIERGLMMMPGVCAPSAIMSYILLLLLLCLL